MVGITEFAPMDYKDDNGQWTGFDAELAKLVAERLGWKFSSSSSSGARRSMSWNSKAIDVVWNGMTASPTACRPL